MVFAVILLLNFVIVGTLQIKSVDCIFQSQIFSTGMSAKYKIQTMSKIWQHSTALMFYTISTLLFISTIGLTETSNELEDLQIHYTFKPEVCDRKAVATNVLTLHYRGTLENGHVFDSR